MFWFWHTFRTLDCTFYRLGIFEGSKNDFLDRCSFFVELVLSHNSSNLKIFRRCLGTSSSVSYFCKLFYCFLCSIFKTERQHLSVVMWIYKYKDRTFKNWKFDKWYLITNFTWKPIFSWLVFSPEWIVQQSVLGSLNDKRLLIILHLKLILSLRAKFCVTCRDTVVLLEALVLETPTPEKCTRPASLSSLDQWKYTAQSCGYIPF